MLLGNKELVHVATLPKKQHSEWCFGAGYPSLCIYRNWRQMVKAMISHPNEWFTVKADLIPMSRWRCASPCAPPPCASASGAPWGATRRPKRAWWWPRNTRPGPSQRVPETCHMGVSINGGTPNRWFINVYNGKSDSDGWFRGSPILGNPHIGFTQQLPGVCNAIFWMVFYDNGTQDTSPNLR